MTETGAREYNVEVDSKILDIDPSDEGLTEAVASAGAELIRVEPPRFTVRVKASSESEAGRLAVEALERRFSGPGAGWHVVGVSQWLS
jgi:hypothetical protein